MTGTLAQKHARGFGFIKPDDGSMNIFMHASALPRGEFDLVEVGVRLVFDVDADDDGRRRAVDARIADDDTEE